MTDQGETRRRRWRRHRPPPSPHRLLVGYQVGVGKTPINVLGVPIGNVPKTKEELLWAEIEEMLAANNDSRIEKFRILMETEIEQLDQFFKRADIVGVECAMQEFVAARRTSSTAHPKHE